MNSIKSSEVLFLLKILFVNPYDISLKSINKSTISEQYFRSKCT